MYLFVVTPHAFDSQFQQKLRLLSKLARSRNVEVGWASPTDLEDTPEELVGLEQLRRSDWVIGDLSFERPSCYFEIGLAQGLKKPVSLIAQRGTVLHQVIDRKNVAFYSDMKEYETVVRKILQHVVSVHR